MGLIQKILKSGITYDELIKNNYSLKEEKEGIFYFSNNYIPLYLIKIEDKYFINWKNFQN